MVRYERQADDAQNATAVFDDGTRVSLEVKRERAFPELRGIAPDTSAAYAIAAKRLSSCAVHVADLGCGSGAGTAVLARERLEVLGIDESREALSFARRFASGVRFERGRIECGDALSQDAVVMIDVLGLDRDDGMILRGVARRVRAGTTLVGAVPVAEVGQTLRSPAHRAFSAEQLDALLVRSGWSPPVQLARVDGLLVFESHRVEACEALRALELADTLEPGHAAESLLVRLATAARRTEDPSLARELMLTTAALQLARGDINAADEASTAANGIAPRSARPMVMLGRVARARGAQDDAEALFDHALGIDECCVEAWRELAAWHEERGAYAVAAELLACAASLEPADHAIAAAEARALGVMGDGARAIRVIDRVLAYGAGVSANLRAAMGWLGTAGLQRSQATSRPITGVFAVAPSRSGSGARLAS